MAVERSTINAHVFIGGRDVSIGRDAFINYGVFIDNAASVRIGARVSLGPRVTILTGTHRVSSGARRAGDYKGRPVVIEDGAWVGAAATILPGVTIGRGALVGAGALVTKNVHPDTQVVGVPAVVVRALAPLNDAEGQAVSGGK